MSPWIAPFLNGIQTPIFRASRGLRKVCPLSPLMYVIMAETLNRTLEWENINDSILGVKIAQGVKCINHSQFVDDMILLSGASKIMARRINQVLDTFLLVSGGLLNKAKCQIYVWNVSANIRAGIAQIMGFGISSYRKTFKYLGLPLCLKSLPGEYWHLFLQNVRENMESWGSRCLNPVGRMILIKLVLSTLPLFQFSSLLALKGVLKDMAHLIRKFLWQGGKSNSKKFHLVNWDIVSTPKKSGGLGIRDPEVENIAMGSKLLWRIVSGRKEWWKTTIIKKYRLGGRKRCMDNMVDPQPGSQIWKLIRASIPSFKEHLSWIPRNGKLIRLWKDLILGVYLTSREDKFGDLKIWLMAKQKCTLFDISTWNENGSWKEWSLGCVPAHVAHLFCY
jgi:hypothetical protein